MNLLQHVSPLLCCLAIFLSACTTPVDYKEIPIEEPSIDLQEIKERGSLILLTQNTSLSYFIYKGNPIGYDYELIKQFCNHHKINLEVIVLSDLNNMFDDLDSLKGDIIGCNLTITADRKQKVNFTDPLLKTHQVLVQRDENRDSTTWLTTLSDLNGKTIHVHKFSSFYKRLINLKEEQGIDINIVEAEGSTDSETLIAMVANNEIDYTVADENYAKLSNTYFNNLNYDLQISLPQQIAWAVRKSSDSLLVELNKWLSLRSNKKDIAYLHNKYFKFIKTHRKKVKSSYSSLYGDKISIYDETIKREAKKLGWDWRLLASLINKESSFDPDVVSWAGAFGLMQLMPGTGKLYDIDSTQTEHENIVAGVKYLKYLDKYWSKRIENNKERINFVLGSYNAGLGHIEDARLLAQHIGLDKNLWSDNVEAGLRLKSDKRYYKLPFIKNGFCRGKSVIQYVNIITEMSGHYVLIKEK